MANAKNSNRRKRKYADRAPKTAANKDRRLLKHESRKEYFKKRAEALVGKRVEIRTSSGKSTGTVVDLTTAPEGSTRKNGTFLVVGTQDGNVTISRHRVKVL